MKSFLFAWFYLVATPQIDGAVLSGSTCDPSVISVDDIPVHPNFDVQQFSGVWYVHATTTFHHGDLTRESAVRVIGLNDDGSVYIKYAGYDSKLEQCVHGEAPGTVEYGQPGSYRYVQRGVLTKYIYTDYQYAVAFMCFAVNNDLSCTGSERQVEVWSKTTDTIPGTILDNLKTKATEPTCIQLDDLKDTELGLCDASIFDVAEKGGNSASHCDPSPCQNGGTCIEGEEDYTCECSDGYEGEDCEVDVDDCIADFCLHGGTCVDLVNDVKCICPTGTTGEACDLVYVTVQTTVLSSTSILISTNTVPEDLLTVDRYKINFHVVGSSVISTVETQSMPYTLTGLQKFTEYGILFAAIDDMGFEENAEQVIVKTFSDVPSAPVQNVVAMTIGPTSINTTWDPVPQDERNGIITRYQVVIRHGRQLDNLVQVGADDGFYTQTGLEPSTTYNVAVVPFTERGSGPGSSWVSVTTPEENTVEQNENDVPEAVNNIQAEALTSTSIHVTWDPVLSSVTPITAYMVVYVVAGKGVVSYIRTANTEFTLTGLRKFTIYSVSVVAYNANGRGRFKSDVLLRTLHDVPGQAPRNVQLEALDSSSFRIFWTPPVRSEQNGFISGYKIGVRGPDGCTTQVKVSQDVHAHTFEGLAADSVYSAVVFARVDDTDGPGSNFHTVRTLPEGVGIDPKEIYFEEPSNVRNLQVQATTSTSISVSWESPVITYLPAFKYRVIFNVVGENANSLMDTENTELTITGLRKYTNYEVRVIAYNSNGKGLQQPTSIQVQTLSDIPGQPPQNITLQAQNSTSVLVTWNPVPVDERNGIVIQYRLVYMARNKQCRNPFLVRIPGNIHSYVLTSLQPNTTYLAIMMAETRHEHGPASAWKAVTTMPDATPCNIDKASVCSAFNLEQFLGVWHTLSRTLYIHGGQSWQSVVRNIHSDADGNLFVDFTALRPGGCFHGPTTPITMSVPGIFSSSKSGSEMGVNMQTDYMIKYTYDENQGFSATDFMSIKIGFITTERRGILMQVKDVNNMDYISMEMNNNGGVRFLAYKGFDRYEINTPSHEIFYNNGQQHEAKMWRTGPRGRTIHLQVDDYPAVHMETNLNGILDNPKYLFIGNNSKFGILGLGQRSMCTGFLYAPTIKWSDTATTSQGFEGCIFGVQIDNIFPLKIAFQDPQPSFVELKPDGKVIEGMCGETQKQVRMFKVVHVEEGYAVIYLCKNQNSDGTCPANQRQIEIWSRDRDTHVDAAIQDRLNDMITRKLCTQPSDLSDGNPGHCEIQNDGSSSEVIGGDTNSDADGSEDYPPSKPTITGYVEGQGKKVGDILQLVCISRGGNPAAELVWFMYSEMIDSSYNIYSGDNNRSENVLTFIVAQIDNDAIYTCEASNPVTPEPLMSQIQLTVHFPPVTTTISGSKLAQAGEQIELTCESSNSNPAAVITWFSRGRRITETQNEVTPSVDGGFITRSSISVTLSGHENNVIYTCQATNELIPVTVTDTVTLSLLYPPSQPNITGYVEGQVKKVGDILRLGCISRGGNPAAQVVWFRNNEMIDLSHYSPENVLTFKVARRDNNAIYTCKASNPVTPEPLMSQIQLTVHFPPVTTTISGRKLAKAGEQIELTCESSNSNPAAVITWFSRGRQIVETQNEVTPSVDGGFITRSSISVTLSGQQNNVIYTCQATNELIPVTVTDTVTLRLLLRTRIYEPPQNISVIRGTNAVLTCGVENDPDVAVSWIWYKYDRYNQNKFEVTDTRRHTISPSGDLTITAVSMVDIGKYECQVISQGGNDSRTAFIQVIELPNPPVNLGVSNIRERSVLVQFYPGSDSIMEWIVEGQEGDDLTWKEIYRTSATDANSIQVLNLKPYTQYVLRIIAANIVSRGMPSLPTRSFQTLQAPPSSPPDNVTVRAVNATALRVSWTPLTKQNWNGNPRGYKIYYKSEEDVLFNEVMLNMDKDSYILGNLQEWMIYEVKMMAYNDVGSSAHSPVTSVRTRDATTPCNIDKASVCSAFNLEQFLGIWHTLSRTLYIYGDQTWQSVVRNIHSDADGNLFVDYTALRPDGCFHVSPRPITMSVPGIFTQSTSGTVRMFKVVHVEEGYAVIYLCSNQNSDGTCPANQRQIEIWSHDGDTHVDAAVQDRLNGMITRKLCTQPSDLADGNPGQCPIQDDGSSSQIVVDSSSSDDVGSEAILSDGTSTGCDMNAVPLQSNLQQTQFLGVWYTAYKTSLVWGDNQWTSDVHKLVVDSAGYLNMIYTAHNGELCTPVTVYKLINEQESVYHFTYGGKPAYLKILSTDYRYALVKFCFDRDENDICKHNAHQFEIWTRDKTADVPLDKKNRLLQPSWMANYLCITPEDLHSVNNGHCEIPDILTQVLDDADTNTGNTNTNVVCNLDDLPVQENFEISQMSGLWYEIARTRFTFNKMESCVYYFEKESDTVLSSQYSGTKKGVCHAALSSMTKQRGPNYAAAEMLAKIGDSDSMFPWNPMKVIYVDDNYLMYYACYEKLEDGTCAHNKQEVTLMGRRRYIEPVIRSRITALLTDYCISPDELVDTKFEADCTSFIQRKDGEKGTRCSYKKYSDTYLTTNDGSPMLLSTSNTETVGECLEECEKDPVFSLDTCAGVLYEPDNGGSCTLYMNNSLPSSVVKDSQNGVHYYERDCTVRRCTIAVQSLPVQQDFNVDQFLGDWFIIAFINPLEDRSNYQLATFSSSHGKNMVLHLKESESSVATARIQPLCESSTTADYISSYATSPIGQWSSVKILYTDYSHAVLYICSKELDSGMCSIGHTFVFLLSKTADITSEDRSRLENVLVNACLSPTDLIEVTDHDASLSQYTEDLTNPINHCAVENLPLQRNFNFSRMNGYWYEIAQTYSPMFRWSSVLVYYQPHELRMGYAGASEDGVCMGPVIGNLRPRCPGASVGDFFGKFQGFPMAKPAPLRILYTDYDNVLIPYSCMQTRADGSCEPFAQRLHILSREKSITPELRAQLDDIVSKTCTINPAELVDITHQIDCSPVVERVFNPSN